MELRSFPTLEGAGSSFRERDGVAHSGWRSAAWGWIAATLGDFIAPVAVARLVPLVEAGVRGDGCNRQRPSAVEVEPGRGGTAHRERPDPSTSPGQAGREERCCSRAFTRRTLAYRRAQRPAAVSPVSVGAEACLLLPDPAPDDLPLQSQVCVQRHPGLPGLGAELDGPPLDRGGFLSAQGRGIVR